jgi:hypothetical protein
MRGEIEILLEWENGSSTKLNLLKSLAAPLFGRDRAPIVQ